MLIESVSGPKLLCGVPPPPTGYDADIIILTLGRLQETVAAVDSALSQKGISAHVTVLDQRATPESRATLVNAFGALKNFALYAATDNLGVGGGRNFLSALGHGRIIAALDNDAMFADEFVVARALARFDENARLGALGFKILSGGAEGLDSRSWGYPAPLKTRCDGRFIATTFVGAGHAIRRTTWNQAGGYDSKLFFTWEEYDFCLRAIALNWLVEYDGSLAVLHKVSPEARVSWSAERMRLFVRNRLMIARKWRASWFVLLPRMAGYLFKGVLNHRLGAAIAGICEAAGRDGQVEKRKMTLAMRRYLQQHDGRHRGSILQRLKTEVFAKIPIDR
jgi:GT2 family glycosyltransferase